MAVYRMTNPGSPDLRYIKADKKRVGWMKRVVGGWDAYIGDKKVTGTNAQEAFDLILVAIGAFPSVERLRYIRNARRDIRDNLKDYLDGVICTPPWVSGPG